MHWNSVTNTCTCGHITEWDITLPHGKNVTSIESRRANLKSMIEYVSSLLKTFTNNDTGHKMVIATVVGEQTEGSYSYANELLENTGWSNVFVGEVYNNNNTGYGRTECREDDTGDLTLWAVTPPQFYEAAKVYKAKLETELRDLDKKAEVSAEELAKRAAFPELRLINLVKAGLVLEGSLLDNRVSSRLATLQGGAALAMHLKIQYGVDFQDLYQGQLLNKTFREVKNYHAEWRAGRK